MIFSRNWISRFRFRLPLAFDRETLAFPVYESLSQRFILFSLPEPEHAQAIVKAVARFLYACALRVFYPDYAVWPGDVCVSAIWLPHVIEAKKQGGIFNA